MSLEKSTKSVCIDPIQECLNAQSTIGNVNMNVPGEISMQKERTLQLVVSVTRA